MSAVENQELRVEHATPGTALAAARNAHNLSVAEVARQLKLSVRQVEAIEAGAFDRLPGPVFVRGFIRNYARLFKLDPDVLLRSIEPDLPASPAHDETPPSQEIPFPAAMVSRWPKYAMAALLVMAGLVAYEFYWNEPPAVTVTQPVPAPTVVAPATQSIVQASADTVAASSPAQERGPAVEPPAQTKRKAPAPAVLPENEALLKPSEGELRLVFDEESWVAIRDRGGKMIFAQLNPGGTEQRVSGRPPFTLVVGNARGVRLTYNDRPVDLERYIRVDVARLSLE